jgi:hypothetical protein
MRMVELSLPVIQIQGLWSQTDGSSLRRWRRTLADDRDAELLLFHAAFEPLGTDGRLKMSLHGALKLTSRHT